MCVCVCARACVCARVSVIIEIRERERAKLNATILCLYCAMLPSLFVPYVRSYDETCSCHISTRESPIQWIIIFNTYRHALAYTLRISRGVPSSLFIFFLFCLWCAWFVSCRCDRGTWFFFTTIVHERRQSGSFISNRWQSPLSRYATLEIHTNVYRCHLNKFD